MRHPTVHDVWRLALPAGTELCNSAGELNRPVSWARRMATHAPALAGLEEDEIVFLDSSSLRILDERLTLAKVITTMAERRVAAVGVLGPVESSDSKTADAHNLALLQLPEDADLRTIERDVMRLIVEREAQLDRRGREIYRWLAQFSIENQGLDAIAQGLHRIVRRPVLIQDTALKLLASASSNGTRAALWRQLGQTGEADPMPFQDALYELPHFQDGDLSAPLDGKAPPCTVTPLASKDWGRCVAAIVVEERLAGFVSILGRRDSLDELDRLAVERAALVCAVELSKQRAISDAEHRLRGDFLNMLLTAGKAEKATLARRAAEMHYQLGGTHQVLLFAFSDSTPRTRSVIAQEFKALIAEHPLRTFLCAYEAWLAVFCAVDRGAVLPDLGQVGQTILERVPALVPGIDVTIGLGQPGAELAGLRLSFHQAQETLLLALDLFGYGKMLHYGDLALYHLLQRFEQSEEATTFYRRTLDALVAYDVEHNSELVMTLNAYFAHLGNVSQTAESLHLHRNSLIYRLNRISEISGIDLDDPDTRFALQLALKLHPFFAEEPLVD